MSQTRGAQFFGIPLSIFFVMFVPGHMFNWAVEWLWLGIQLVVSVVWLFVLTNRKRPVAGIPPSVWSGFFLIVTAAGFLSCLHATVTMNMRTSVSDIPDLLRFLIFIPLALFIGVADREELGGQLAKVLKFVIVFNLVTAAILLVNLPVASDIIMLIYEEAKIQVDFGHIRIGIPFTNPNFAALVFVLALGFFSFFRKSKTFVLLTLISLFLTGSRSGLLSAGPILFALYVMTLVRSVRSMRLLVLIVLAHVLVIASLSVVLEAMGGLARIEELIDALAAGDLGQVDTASIRFDLVQEALRFIERSPLLGVGPGRSYGLDVTDCQLIAWPVGYGIPLALMLCVFFAWLFVGAIRKTRSREHALGAIATGAAFFLMLSTGDFMKNYRLFYITVLIAHTIYTVVSIEQEQRSIELNRAS